MLASIRTLLPFALIPVAALAHDISGKWMFQVDAGSGSPTFVFKQTGEKLTGLGGMGSATWTGTRQ